MAEQEDTQGCCQQVFLNVKKQGERSIISTITPSHIKRVDSITINFSCQTTIKIPAPHHQGRRQSMPVVTEQEQPLMFNTVRVDRPQILYSDTTHEAVKKELGGWNMSNYWREWMIKNVLSSVRDMVKTVPEEFNALDVLVEVIVVHDHTGKECGPATDSTILAKKKKKNKGADSGKKHCRVAIGSRISHAFSHFLFGH